MEKIKTILNIAYEELKKAVHSAIKYEKKDEVIANLKKNLLVMFSAFVFMTIANTEYHIDTIVSSIFSYIYIFIIATQLPDLKRRLSSMPLFVRIYSSISSLGICIFYREEFKAFLNIEFDSFYALNSIISILLAAFSIISVYAIVSIILNWIWKTIGHLFSLFSKAELLTFCMLKFFVLAFSTFSFSSRVLFFHRRTNRLDILYTSDTASIINGNAYLFLFHPENDIRQPLFALFAAPFMGAFYAVSFPLSFISPIFTPLLMNYAQIIMLMTINLMLVRILDLKKLNGICLMLLFTFTYSTLLSSIMMEQYVVALFYLILMVYSYTKTNYAPEVTFTAATGTLLTSMLMLPFAYNNEKNKCNKLRAFFSIFEKNILIFIIIIISFNRFDIIFNAVIQLSGLRSFAGSANAKEQLNQFLNFVSSCFWAPEAAANASIDRTINWQLTNSTITEISISGCVILVLCLISAILNRKNKITRIAAYWTLFSVLLLSVAGWGAVENGMILYSLYFCWAYLILLFQLVIWISDKLRCNAVVILASLIALVSLCIANYNGIADLLRFAVSKYPF